MIDNFIFYVIAGIILILITSVKKKERRDKFDKHGVLIREGYSYVKFSKSRFKKRIKWIIRILLIIALIKYIFNL